MPGDQDTYAENAEFWVKIIREGLDRFRTDLTDAAVLGAIGPCAGLTVLDGGCGEGYLSRYLAVRGAAVSGIDTSAALIGAAEQERDRRSLTIEYQVASLEAIPYSDNQFDVVVCNHVMSDVAGPEAALNELGRVTNSGGRLVLLMLHPCFYTAYAGRGDYGDIPVDVYFSTRQIDEKFNVAGIESPGEVHMNFRSLEYYFSLLTGSGYVVTHLSEPHPTPEQVKNDEWWRKTFTKPLFMLVVAERR
ncbi:MAG: methyltransferase domain-containing protein [Pseudonocardiaceae bacterium]